MTWSKMVEYMDYPLQFMAGTIIPAVTVGGLTALAFAKKAKGIKGLLAFLVVEPTVTTSAAVVGYLATDAYLTQQYSSLLETLTRI